MNYSFNFKLDADLAWKLCIFFCASTLFLFLPVAEIFASTTGGTTGGTTSGTTSGTAGGTNTDIAGGGPIGTVLCNVVKVLTGKVGKGIATVAIVFLAIGLFLGKLSWGVALATAVGIAGIFGSAQIVDILGGSTAAAQTCT
jgi:type IV secretory pathway VirB2 component (pilin)